MTLEQKTELEYLLDLVLEASKWKIDDGQDAIRLEVESRINSILSHEDQVVTCEPEISPVLTGDDFTALEAARLNEHLSSKERTKRKWASKRVRVVIDGKPTWKLRSECHKEVMPGWETKMHWVWNGPDADKEPAVDKLSDELWAAHEAGG